MNRWDGTVIPWWAIAALIVLAALLMPLWGCAGQDVREHEEMHCAGFQHQDEAPNGQLFRYEWVQTRPASAKPWEYRTVADVDFACRMSGADPYHRLHKINGCAQWKPTGCTIYLREE